VDEIRISCKFLDSIEYRSMSVTARDLYVWLLRLRQRYGNPFRQDFGRIREAIGVSSRTLSRARDELEGFDLLEYTRGGHGMSSRWKLKTPYWMK
jgi:hypothetical protein